LLALLAPALSDSFATWRCSCLFFLINSATIAFSWPTRSLLLARPRRDVRFFDPGGLPLRRGAFACASSGAIFTPEKKNRAQQY